MARRASRIIPGLGTVDIVDILNRKRHRVANKSSFTVSIDLAQGVRVRRRDHYTFSVSTSRKSDRDVQIMGWSFQLVRTVEELLRRLKFSFAQAHLQEGALHITFTEEAYSSCRVESIQLRGLCCWLETMFIPMLAKQWKKYAHETPLAEDAHPVSLEAEDNALRPFDEEEGLCLF